MAYNKTTWVDGSTPAISAANLNNIEDGIYGHDVDISAIKTALAVEDISAQLTLGGAWSQLIRVAYRVGNMVFFYIEASTSSYTADYDYTIATFASGYRPSGSVVCNGYTTDGNYNPKSVVSAILQSNGGLHVRASNNSGAYFFVTGFFKIG